MPRRGFAHPPCSGRAPRLSAACLFLCSKCFCSLGRSHLSCSIVCMQKCEREPRTAERKNLGVIYCLAREGGGIQLLRAACVITVYSVTSSGGSSQQPPSRKLGSFVNGSKIFARNDCSLRGCHCSISDESSRKEALCLNTSRCTGYVGAGHPSTTI